jgi:hypothetical protein
MSAARHMPAHPPAMRWQEVLFELLRNYAGFIQQSFFVLQMKALKSRFGLNPA